MKNILFPTDFTELSLNAFNYALDYAKKTNNKLIVFHAYNPEAETTEEALKVYTKIDIQNFRSKKDAFPPFEKIRHERGYDDIVIKYVVVEGDFINTFKKYIWKREDKIDLVIMGAHNNKNRLLQLFIETNTIKILEEIDKPVIAVPEGSVFDGNLDYILFLVDYKEDEKEPLEDLIEKAKEFNAKIDVVHFDLAHSESIVPQIENFKNSIEAANYENVTFSSIDTIDIKKSLLHYCEENKVDMVCLINHQRNFYQRLFSYSLTEELINNINIPVMAIYRE